MIAETELIIGDMVYVDAYGPTTLGYSNGTIDVKRDKPFKPKLYDFTSDVQYEVIFIEGNDITLFDDENYVIGISKHRVRKDIPFTDKNGFVETV